MVEPENMVLPQNDSRTVLKHDRIQGLSAINKAQCFLVGQERHNTLSVLKDTVLSLYVRALQVDVLDFIG